MCSFYILINNVLDATPLPPQFSAHKDLPRFDTSEGFDSSTQYSAGSLTTDLLSSMIDTETNFDWVSLSFLNIGSLPFHVSVLTSLEKGLWDSHFQAIPANTMPTGLQDFGSFTF
jgi:hypothetical protein